MSAVIEEAPSTIFLKDYQPTPYGIDHVAMDFILEEKGTTVTTVMQVYRREGVSADAPLRLDGEELSLQSVEIDSKALPDSQYSVDDNALTIRDVPASFTLKTVVRIKPQENTELSGLYLSSGNYCTQCEPHGFRRITYFYDRPDVMTRFTTTMTGDKSQYPAMLANGNCIEEKTLDNGQHWVKWEDPSLKPAYLFALVAGDFDVLRDHFVTMSGREVALVFYVDKGYLDQASYAMGALQRSMKWDEETFGREYDLDIYMVVAVGDFNMGAMENKGLNVFNTKYVLAKAEMATDNDYVNIERVIGHEYFHNWTGNRVTCRDWFQITLKEGLTVLREQLFSADMTSVPVIRIKTANMMRTVQFAQDAGPMSHPIRPDSYIEINNFYTVTVYEKGSEVIRMMRTYVGEATFRQAMDLYFERHDGSAVTTEDFVAAISDASGKDLSQFCRWYSQGGTPELTVTGHYHEANKEFHLTVKQYCKATPDQPNKACFQLPLLVGLIGANGPLTETRLLDVTKQEETFVFENVIEKPVPSLLRDFSAPVKLHYAYTNDELLQLLSHDTDAFSRWDAGQRYMLNEILRLAKCSRENADMVCDAALADTFTRLVSDESQDPQLLAMMLTLPSEGYCLEEMEEAHVESVHLARVFLKTALATVAETELQSRYMAAHVAKPYVYDGEQMGRRCIQNVALSYLCLLESGPYRLQAVAQFEQSNNMTDTMGALCALNDIACDERETMSHAFKECWANEPLVIDKWLSLQASSALPDTLSRVKAIMDSTYFDLLNPNKVRALLGAFGGNLLHFHAADGSGYALLADQVLALDQHNKLTAARLCAPLTQWKKQDELRQGLMKAQLQRMLDATGLSKDVFEIVSKSLV